MVARADKRKSEIKTTDEKAINNNGRMPRECKKKASKEKTQE